MSTDTLSLVVHQLGYDRVQDVGYVVLFAVLLIDGLCIPFTPIEVYLMLAGYLSAIGVLNIFEAFAVMTAGALIGNILSYGFGYKVGHGFFSKYGKYFLVTPQRFDKLQAMVKQFGMSAPFVFRFIPGVRPVASPLLGTARVPFVNFVLLSLVAITIWNVVFLTIGYYFGLRFAEHAVWIIPLGIGIMLFGIIATVVLWAVRSKHNA
ncbi:MAG: DedA family protein [Patescibacteria group bacterium]